MRPIIKRKANPKDIRTEILLILREVAAIGIRLSHASQGVASATPANRSVTRR
tara:strand:- start:181 stop:339 length:159 start_codon:yes stop_codon:yes gene_type:complete